ncbi:MAG: hydantoinase/oxoprolinase family protein [bacterium]|nr:hydantoinase/oxoprolinase family protein [bacterium]MDE0352421.1 hydantoinase/oxoprolinase family protein [bacterium]
MTWTVAIDIGGTFTDVVADDGIGQRLTAKVPTVPADPALGLLDALSALGRRGMAFEEVSLVFHGTTIATNAVINDMLARVVLLTTKGFRDILTYRSGSRPDAYDLRQSRPREFIPRGDRIEVDERVTATGTVRALTASETGRAVNEVASRDPEAVAISFLFSYLDDSHERTLADALEAACPGLAVSRSSEVANEFREYPRTVTTAVNAGLRPVVRDYLQRAEDGIRDLGIPGTFLVMQSNGGGVPAARAEGEAHKLLVSGPAAGVAGAVALGAATGRTHLLSLDIGGTSADVCLIRNGLASVSPMRHIESHPILSPSLDIHSAGAGGGSIVAVDRSGALKVGPASAGADPGPAAYGRGGRNATLTDAHLVAGTLGELTALGGSLTLDRGAALDAIAGVGAGLGLNPQATAEGVLAIANAHLEAAIRRVSIDRGEDPRRYALVAFGGAGPLHAGRLIRDLSMPEAVIPRHPGLFSAAGLLATDLRIDESATVLTTVDNSSIGDIARWFETTGESLRARLRADGIEDRQVRVEPSIDCRYRGQGFELNVPVASTELSPEGVCAEFRNIHGSLYGHTSDEPVVAVTLRMSAFGSLAVGADRPTGESFRSPTPVAKRLMKLREMPRPAEVPVYRRDDLGPGARLAGPCVVEQPDATTVVLDGQSTRVDRYQNLIIREAAD